MEKKIKIFDDVIIIFWKKCLELFFLSLFFFLEMIFKHKTIFIFFILMTWLDKWQQGRTHIRHILFKFFANLCYIKIIKVIKFGDKIFNRTKVINKKPVGVAILPPPPPPPPPQNRVNSRSNVQSNPQPHLLTSIIRW